MIVDTLLKVVRIPAGEFTMGSGEADEDERPAHGVHLDEYHIGVHEVTNEEYAQFVRETKHPAPAVRYLPLMVTLDREATFREIAASYVWRDGAPPPDRIRHPVTLVRVDDTLEYCQWLAARSGKPVRLPTEAEWEKAARGGLEGKRYPWGDDIDPSRANFLPDPSLKLYRGTQEVGSYPPNAYGLYDIAGNVWEWVLDWYRPNYYATGEPANPRGPQFGSLRIVRGGAWVNDDVSFLTCSHRHKVPPDTYTYSIGFRIAYAEK